MKTLVTVLILFAMLGLVMWQYQAQVQVLEKHQQKKQIQVASQVSEQQLQCNDTAFARYKALRLETNRSARYKGHFNTTLNQCYSLIESTDSTLDTLWKRVTLYDGDGRVFGSYAWHSQSDKRASEVPPFNCDVAAPGGEHRSCSSETEFRYLADTYYMK